MKIFYSLVLLSFLTNGILSHSIPDGYKLEQIQALFRHGDRVPEKMEVYATDPHDDLFKKLGYGQLTNIGKQREYKIGEVLRERYNDFIGDYKFDEVYAYSTPYDRTKMSLQLVLAGLFPPTDENAWSKTINWLPIPTHYDDTDENLMTNYFCPAFIKMFGRYRNSSEVQSKIEKYSKLFSYLKEHIEIGDDGALGGLILYQNIRAVLSMGLPLPDWYNDEVFSQLEELAALFFKLMTDKQQMARIVFGPIIERFLQNVKVDESDQEWRKVYLFSGHDMNVAPFINWHNITGVPVYADYGSTIVLEKLRGADNGIYLRFFLWTGTQETWIPLKIEDCKGYICPLSVYERITKPIMPDAAARRCTSIQAKCGRTRSRSAYLDKFTPLARLAYLINDKALLSFKYTRSLISEVSENEMEAFHAISNALKNVV